jgi:cystathionine beta-lyase family protein involved in aluminum resistance
LAASYFLTFIVDVLGAALQPHHQHQRKEIKILRAFKGQKALIAFNGAPQSPVPYKW